jgi:hypothetical protein
MLEFSLKNSWEKLLLVRLENNPSDGKNLKARIFLYSKAIEIKTNNWVVMGIYRPATKI